MRREVFLGREVVGFDGSLGVEHKEMRRQEWKGMEMYRVMVCKGIIGADYVAALKTRQRPHAIRPETAGGAVRRFASFTGRVAGEWGGRGGDSGVRDREWSGGGRWRGRERGDDAVMLVSMDT